MPLNGKTLRKLLGIYGFSHKSLPLGQLYLRFSANSRSVLTSFSFSSGQCRWSCPRDTRFSELSPDLEKLQKKNQETEQRLALALKETDSLKAKLGKAEKELETAQVRYP